MANETVVRLTGDASGYVSEMERARKSAADFVTSQDTLRQRLANSVTAIENSRKALKEQGDEALNSFNKSARAAEQWLTSLQRQADQAGKTRSQLLELRAAELGVADAAQPYIERIKAAEDALNKGGEAAHGFNLKTAAARRELLVLAHEASQGQWKNFGGSMLVLGERTDALSAILSPGGIMVGGFAATLGLLAAAAIKGAEEQNKLNQAIIMTGGYAGLTRGNLESMVEAIGQSGTKIGTAKEVMLSLAESGRFTGAQIATIAPAAAAMAETTGMAVKDVVKQFESLAEEPTKASAKLNEQYHFLTLSVYEQIAALEKQGDKIAAASVAEKAWADAANDRVKSIKENLGFLETAWHSVGNAASSAWSRMMGFGKTQTTEQQIASLQDSLKQQQDYLGLPLDGAASGISKQIELLQEKLRLEQRDAERQATIKQKSQDAIEAEVRIDKMRDQIMSNAQKRTKELKQLADDRERILAGGGKFSDAEYSKMVADINDKYKDHTPKAYTDDGATRYLQHLRDQASELQLQLSMTDKLSNAQKDMAKFNQQIGDWKGKTLTADQKSLIANQDAIRAQLQTNVELEKQVKLHDSITKLQERSAQIQASIRSYQQGQNDQYSRQLGAFGMGAEALKNVQAVKSIYAEYQRLQEQLDKATPKDALGSKAYMDASEQIQEGLKKSLEDYDAYYAALRDKQSEWTNGAAEAFANYLDTAHNVAKQAEQAFTSAMRGMEDAIASMVTTGKFNFKSLVDSMIADIVRMQARAAMSGLLGSLASIGGSLLGGFFASNTGLAASAASALPGDSLDNMLKLTDNFASLPQRAAGGPVAGGTAYLVGERGPEMFVPGQGGSIVPNHALGSGAVVNVQLVEDSSKAGQVEQQQSGGGVDIRAYVAEIARKAITSDMASGQGDISKVFAQRFGLTPKFR